MRALVPLAVTASILTSWSPTTAQVRGPVAVALISAPGNPYSTVNQYALPYTTTPGRTYQITVTGTYSHDGRFALSDCGHKDPAGPAGWINVSNVNLDGVPARCVSMSFNETHTYQWDQRGTGKPFTFEIPNGSAYAEDDIGYLIAIIYEE